MALRMTKKYIETYTIEIFAEDLKICSNLIAQKCIDEPFFDVSKTTKKAVKIILTGLKAQIGMHIPYEANKADIRRISEHNKEVVQDLQECSDIVTRNLNNLTVKVAASIVKDFQPWIADFKESWDKDIRKNSWHKNGVNPDDD